MQSPSAKPAGAFSAIAKKLQSAGLHLLVVGEMLLRYFLRPGILSPANSFSFDSTMSVQPERETHVLLVSADPQLADARRHVLELAGYTVSSAVDFPQLQNICRKLRGRFELVIIGHFLAPDAKRRIWHEVRKYSAAPILELYPDGGSPNLPDVAAFLHESRPLGDFIETVKAALQDRDGFPAA